MVGRKPKPTALKVLQGNPGKRPLNKREPKPPAGMPKCPTWLDGMARAAWLELAPLLEQTKVVTESDRKALELLCDAYSEYRRTREIVRKQGATYEALTEGGSIMIRPRPEVTMAQDAWKRVRAMLQEFGLTPSSRSKIQVVQDAAEDPYEAFRHGSGG